MSTTYLEPEDYPASPRSTDPVDLLAEERIRTGWLLGQLDAADVEIRAREHVINQLLSE